MQVSPMPKGMSFCRALWPFSSPERTHSVRESLLLNPFITHAMPQPSIQPNAGTPNARLTTCQTLGVKTCFASEAKSVVKVEDAVCAGAQCHRTCSHAIPDATGVSSWQSFSHRSSLSDSSRSTLQSLVIARQRPKVEKLKSKPA